MSAEEHHPNSYYVKIWGILLVLLAISIIGPEFGIQAVTLVTAFGIAVVKALIVARKFMHIDEAPKFVTYIVVTCLVFMLLFFAGTAPDVMNDSGDNWVKDAGWHVDAGADNPNAHSYAGNDGAHGDGQEEPAAHH